MSIYAETPIDLDATPAKPDEALVPLIDRLRAVLDQIPPSIKRQGLPLETIRERLNGRTKGKAHVGELGKALVRLGYERHRDWSAGASYGARWYPRGHCPKSGYHSKQRLRDERPDLFPARVGRTPRWLMDARRQAADDLQRD